VLDVMDNCDGTLSIFGTVLDSANPVAAPGSGTSAAGLDEATLASIGRVLTWNDPQVGPGGPEGKLADRNAELIVRDPRRLPPACAGANIVPGAGGAAPAKGPKPKIKLTIRPKKVRGGRRTCFVFRTTSGRRVVPGATVRFASRRFKTGNGGARKLCFRIYLSKRGHAKKSGFQTGRAKVKVTRRKR
jgi:hypothetical protein